MNEPEQPLAETGDKGRFLGTDPSYSQAKPRTDADGRRRSRRAAVAAVAAFALEFFPPYRRLLQAFVRRLMARAEGSTQD